MAIGDYFTARVERIVSGGSGLLRVEGKTVFMDTVAPGDRVAGRVIEDKGSWARAELVELIEPSPLRVEPPCPLYGECGGCSLQHLDYAEQLMQKKMILQDAFSRIAELGELPEPRVVPSAPYGYRNRMQFHRVSRPKTGMPPVGLKRHRSDEILPVSDCPVADEGIRRALKEGSLRPRPDQDRFTVFSRGPLLLQEGAASRGIVKVLDKELRLDASGFFQSNVAVLEALIPDLLAACSPCAGAADIPAAAADLYCGVGTFAVFLADDFERLDLMEQNKAALALARENLRREGVRYFALKDDDWARLADKEGSRYGFAVVDPPRAGLSDALRRTLAAGGPPILAYVSCDSATLARDAGSLTAAGYRVESLTLYDFYPQTAHIETLAILRKDR